MNFRSVAGQKEVITGLENSIKNEKVGHAYMFCGPKGCGKRMVTKIFAGMLLCQNPILHESDKNIDMCGSCSACRLREEGTNPDFYTLAAEENSISVEDIRKLQSDIMIRPFYSKRKIYLIEEADKMTVQAQNCLLKTLEEPPRYVVILLTVSNEDALLETIHSRVTKIHFKKNTAEEVRQVVESRLKKVVENMDFIISYSDGIIGTALELADSEEFSRIRQRVIEIIERLTKSKLLDVFEVYDFFEDNKNNMDIIFDIMILFYRDLLVATRHWDENILINSDKKDIIFSSISKFSTGKLVRNIEVIEMTRKNLKYNANFQLAIEMMLMKLQEE